MMYECTQLKGLYVKAVILTTNKKNPKESPLYKILNEEQLIDPNCADKYTPSYVYF